MTRPSRKKPRPVGGRLGPSSTMAEEADPLVLYQEAVQAPEADVSFFSNVFRAVLGGHPGRLREDFCGGGAVCCSWVSGRPEREAWGVDIDGRTLAWALRNNVSSLSPEDQPRIHLVEADVRANTVPSVDVVCAQNFSYCVFQSRVELLSYFRHCFAGLREKGLLIVDLFGGYESIEDDREDVTDHDDFQYVWEQHRFDPINSRGIYKIHFRFPDGSALEDAFVYDWRLWTIPEIREVMIEAGFGRADVYWEDEDPETREGTGTYSLQSTGDCDPAWNAYIIGVKGG